MNIAHIVVLASLLCTQAALAGALAAAWAAGSPPKFDIAPICKAAASTGVSNARNAEACRRDEEKAQETLGQNWDQFSAAQQTQCVRLSTLGGSPSYVELLTCLEMAKQARDIPASQGLDTGNAVEKPRRK